MVRADTNQSVFGFEVVLIRRVEVRIRVRERRNWANVWISQSRKGLLFLSPPPPTIHNHHHHTHTHTDARAHTHTCIPHQLFSFTSEALWSHLLQQSPGFMICSVAKLSWYCLPYLATYLYSHHPSWNYAENMLGLPLSGTSRSCHPSTSRPTRPSLPRKLKPSTLIYSEI